MWVNAGECGYMWVNVGNPRNARNARGGRVRARAGEGG